MKAVVILAICGAIAIAGYAVYGEIISTRAECPDAAKSISIDQDARIQQVLEDIDNGGDLDSAEKTLQGYFEEYKESGLVKSYRFDKKFHIIYYADKDGVECVIKYYTDPDTF